MKKIAHILLIVLSGTILLFPTAGADAATAKKQYSQTLSIPTGAHIVVRSENSGVVITTWDDERIRIEAEMTVSSKNLKDAQYYLDQLSIHIESSENTFTISSQQPETKLTLKKKSFLEKLFGSADLSIYIAITMWVPQAVNLDVHATHGSVQIENITGRVGVETTDRFVLLNNIRGSVRAHTTNAIIYASVTALGEDGMELTTTNADIRLEIPSHTPATIHADAPGGEIESEFELIRNGPFNGQEHYGWINGGGVNIDLFTRNGRISLKAL